MRITEKMKSLKEYIPNVDDCKIKLDANENPFPMDEDIKKEVLSAVEKCGLSRYPDPMSKDVCESYAKVMGVKESQVVAGCGSDELIGIITGFLLNKGDRVLVFEPDFSMYAFYSFLHELDIISVPKEQGIAFDADFVIKSIERFDPKMVLFSNPCNPTGGAIKSEQVKKILERTQAMVVLDEAYMEFFGDSLVPDINEYENLIILRTMSKAYGFAGGRVGFAAAREEIIREIKKAKSPFNLTKLSQAAACAILKHANKYKAQVDALTVLTRETYARLKEIEKKHPGKVTVFESSANFIYIKCARSQEIFEKLRDMSILIRAYPDGYLRVSTGLKEENDAFLDAFDAILKETGL